MSSIQSTPGGGASFDPMDPHGHIADPVLTPVTTPGAGGLAFGADPFGRFVATEASLQRYMDGTKTELSGPMGIENGAKITCDTRIPPGTHVQGPRVSG